MDGSIFIHIIVTFLTCIFLWKWLDEWRTVSLVLVLGIIKEQGFDVYFLGSDFDWIDILGNFIGAVLFLALDFWIFMRGNFC